MARYRKIHVPMYADAKFRALSRPQPCAQWLWVYMLTGPHTTAIPGLSSVGEAALAESVGWKLEAFREAFGELFAKGMAKADWEARVLWVPNAVRYNPPESPNVIKGWAKAYEEIPACALKVVAFTTLKAFVEGLGEGFREAFAKSMPNQEQEQEQEQDSFSSASADAGDSGEKDAATGAADSDKPARPAKTKTAKKPNPDAKPEHGEVERFFKSRWLALRSSGDAVECPWKHDRDGKHVKWILDQVGRDPEKAKAIIEAFLRDDDDWLADKGHTIGMLVSRFPRYVSRRPTAPPVSDNGFERREVTPEILAAAFGGEGEQ